ncbi:MAG: hypothetical protein GXY83_29495 [Rhodopirellula sp.]|nr:hypothetical protein [Rhodopirellula sp.]
MTALNTSLEKILGEIDDEACDRADPDRAKRRAEFIFHMTDGKDDLERLVRWYQAPEQFDEHEAKEIVAATLYHVTGHLIAAARLYDYVPDPFAASDPQEK